MPHFTSGYKQTPSRLSQILEFFLFILCEWINIPNLDFSQGMKWLQIRLRKKMNKHSDTEIIFCIP